VRVPIIIHPLLEVGGGAEKLALEMHRALRELGYESRILTFVVDEDRLRSAIGLLTPGFKPVLEVHGLPVTSRLMDVVTAGMTRGRMVRLRRALLTGSLIERVQRGGGELLIDTASHLPTPVDISYVHFPLLLSEKHSGLVWGVYNWLVRRVARSLTGDTRLVLVNSTWTKRVFNSIYGSRYRVEILYPPVDVEYFYSGNKAREKTVVTVSRFSPEKRLESILIAAREMPDYHFYILGSATSTSKRVLGMLSEKIAEYGLENVEVRPNVTREELKGILSRAMFYLHPPYPEHFGLSVAEAVAAGAIPIVYRDGGAWTDIVSKIDSSLGYNDISEVPKIVRELEGRPDFLNELRERGQNIVKDFTYDRFKERLAGIIRLFDAQS
jgi:glycosyltransferase involved in cell wall biosynthesis